MHLQCKDFPQHNWAEIGLSVSVNQGATMKKLALVLMIAAFSSGVFAQTETEGGASVGAGGAAGTATVATTNALLITAGVVAAGAVAAGSKAESTTTHR